MVLCRRAHLRLASRYEVSFIRHGNKVVPGSASGKHPPGRPGGTFQITTRTYVILVQRQQLIVTAFTFRRSRDVDFQFL
jgi:hypothetical protein